MALLTYSPKKVTISLAALHTVGGFADGVFVKISKDMTPFKTITAMDGETARLYKEDECYIVELTLAMSSQTNSVLSALYNIDTSTQLGKFPLFIRDGNGTTTFFSAFAWVEQIPDVTYSNAMEVRTWRLHCTYAGLNIGGFGSGIEDSILAGSSFLPLLKEFGVF